MGILDNFYNIKWTKNGLQAIDQRRLPLETVYMTLTTAESVYKAIQSMAIRGAGVLSIAAAYGVYLGVWNKKYDSPKQTTEDICSMTEYMRKCRPTAISLSVAMDQIIQCAEAHKELNPEEQKKALLKKCGELAEKSAKSDREIGENALPLFENGDRVITHCNTGIYASVGIGSAMAPIYLGKERGINLKVFVDETRPVLQGARLTAHELQRAGIDTTLICDNMAGYLMQQGLIDKVIVGCDRIASNGDVVNKVGTYTLAILARYHNLPFYVAGAYSDIDFSKSTGREIPIEQRAPEEVTEGLGSRIAPLDVQVYNPCFDMTPNELITALILDVGIVYPPYKENLAGLL